MTQLTILAGGTIIISCQFKDEDGEPVQPIEAAWTLKDGDGNIVNGRQDVPISPLGTGAEILLSGPDNPGDMNSKRVVTISATYASSLSPDPVPLIEQSVYWVRSL